MKRRSILSLIALVTLLFCLASCETEEKEAVSMYDLQKEMLNASDSLPEMLTVNSSSEDAEEDFSYLSDLDYDKVEGYFLAYASDGSASEIAVICLKDKSDLNACVSSLEKHRDNRVRAYENYMPTEAFEAKNTKIATVGRYVAFIMCSDRDSVFEAFDSFVK